MISAFLDTNVLLGITETDLLLSLSETGGMLRPYWSEYVFDELKEHLPERLEESGSENAFRKACRRIDAMRYAFPESMVPASKWELYSSIAEKKRQRPRRYANPGGSDCLQCGLSRDRQSQGFRHQRHSETVWNFDNIYGYVPANRFSLSSNGFLGFGGEDGQETQQTPTDPGGAFQYPQGPWKNRDSFRHGGRSQKKTNNLAAPSVTTPRTGLLRSFHGHTGRRL